MFNERLFLLDIKFILQFCQGKLDLDLLVTSWRRYVLDVGVWLSCLENVQSCQLCLTDKSSSLPCLLAAVANDIQLWQ